MYRYTRAKLEDLVYLTLPVRCIKGPDTGNFPFRLIYTGPDPLRVDEATRWKVKNGLGKLVQVEGFGQTTVVS